MSHLPTAVILLGDSHYSAVLRAAQLSLHPDLPEAPSTLFLFNAWKYGLTYPFIQDGVLNPELVQNIADIAKTHNVVQIVSLFGGAHHIALTLLDQGQPWDFVSADRPDLAPAPKAKIFSSAYVTDMFAQVMCVPFDIMAAMRKAFPTLPYAQLEAPRPNGDNAYILANLDQYFKNLVPEGTEPRISPASLRLKSWYLQSEMYRRKCAELGMTYLPSPAQAADAQGYLKPEYYGSDASHANGDYGALIIAEIEKLASTKFAAFSNFG